MFNRISKILIAVGSIFFFIFGEGLMVGTVALIGPCLSFSLFSIIYSGIAIIILYLYKSYNVNTKIKPIKKIRGWINKREKKLNKFTFKIAQFNKTLAILISASIFGPFPTAILIGIIIKKQRLGYVLAIIGAILFCVIWVSIYSEAIWGIKLILKSI